LGVIDFQTQGAIKVPPWDERIVHMDEAEVFDRYAQKSFGILNLRTESYLILINGCHFFLKNYETDMREVQVKK